MNEKWTLPDGWTEAPLTEIVCGIEKIEPWEYPNKSFSYIDISSIDNEAAVVSAPKIILGKDAPSRAKQAVKKGDIVFSTVRPYLRAVAQVPPNIDNPVASTGFCVLRAEPSINQKYLLFFVRSEQFLQSLLPLQRGVSYPAVRNNDVLSRLVPIAPRQEQIRIAEKLEELFSDLDDGVTELKAAQVKLSQYRQSLLKSAVEGSLTADWREKNKVQETGEQLLERILKERREDWEKEKLAEFKAKDKNPPKNWKDKYPEPVQPDTSELPELPEGWIWASADQLVLESSYGTSVKCDYDSKFSAVLRIPNIINKRIDTTDLKFATKDLNLDKNKYLNPGDILIVRTNGSISLVGKTAFIPKNFDARYYFASYLLRIRPLLADTLPNWMDLYFGSPIARRWIEKNATSSAGQNNISLSTFLTLPVPLPPHIEQSYLIDKLSNEFQGIDDQNKQNDQAKKIAEAQRKNLLKEAFSGKLVPQDPNDEPASLLLEKIQIERAKIAAQPKPKGVKRKPKSQVVTMKSLKEVLAAKDDWMDAQDAFKECGVVDGTDTDRIEELYAELRALDKTGLLAVEAVTDKKGRKTGDRIKLLEY